MAFKIICDSCGEDVTDKGWYEFRATLHRNVEEVTVLLEEEVQNSDICLECYSKHARWKIEK